MGTTIDDRFEILCTYCGGLSSKRTLRAAVLYASLAERRHTGEYERIEIYDRMAQKGRPELYTSDGKVTEVRNTGLVRCRQI